MPRAPMPGPKLRHPGPHTSRASYLLGRSVLELTGWELDDAVPDVKKAVLIAAPHTSNWDLVYTLAAAFALRVRIQWLGKHTLFAGPVRRRLMTWLGGVPVDRRAPQGLVAQAIEKFAEHDDGLYLVVPPAGTRSAVEHWKSGFYHIAYGAGVPVICGYVDFGRKRVGLGATFELTGDVTADMDRIRAWYEGIEGRHPERAQPIVLKEELAAHPPTEDALEDELDLPDDEDSVPVDR